MNRPLSAFGLIGFLRLLLIATVVVVPLFYFKRGVYIFTTPKTFVLQFFVEIALSLLISLFFLTSKYTLSITPLKIAGLLFISLLIITGFFGVDSLRSFWSTAERGIGIIAFIHFATLSFIFSSLLRELDWKKILYSSVATGLLIDGLALLQILIPNLLTNDGVGDRPGSTFGNPAFLAGYILVHIFIGLYFLFHSFHGRKILTIFWGLSVCINMLTLFITQTRGDILGLLVGLFILLGLFAYSPSTPPLWLSQKKLYRSLFVGFIILSGLFWITRTQPLWNSVPGIRRFQNLSLTTESIQPRLIALRAGWSGFLEKPFLGWGWDNFNIVFNKYHDPRILNYGAQETRFDKPHNLIIEYLCAGGIILFFVFLLLLTTIFYELWQLEDRIFVYSMTAMIIGYIIRSFFVFDTIGPLLLLSIIIGIVDGLYVLKKEKLPKKNSGASPTKFLSIVTITIFTGVALICSYTINLRSLQSFNFQFWGFNYLLNGRIQPALNNFHEALVTWTPYQWILQRDYAIAITGLHASNPDLIPNSETIEAIRVMEDLTSKHPLDSYNQQKLVDAYNTLADLDSDFLAKAVIAGNKAIVLNPNDPTVYFSLAKTYTLTNNYPEAIRLLSHAVSLNPSFAYSHFYYGVVLYSQGSQLNDYKKKKEGYEELIEVMRLGIQWKSGNEPRVLGAIFMDFKDYSSAILAYSKSWDLTHDFKTKIKLAIAYYYNNQKDDAKKIFLELVQSPDFKNYLNDPQLTAILFDLKISL